MRRNAYKPRVIDSTVEEYLKVFAAVCIEGPKWCGKTWTSMHHSKSSFFVGDPENNFQNRRIAELSPTLALQGDTPHLIDEWQEAQTLWDAVRAEADKRALKGQFILTGSSTPKRKGVMHSGVGRIGRLRMHPMSLYETGHSGGEVSLQRLCDGQLEATLIKTPDLHTLADLIVRGGWPDNQSVSSKQSMLLPRSYIDGVVDDEVHRIDEIQRDKHKVMLLLRSLARNESTTATNKTLQNDISRTDDADIDKNTVSSYLDIFSRLFLTENQEPFSSNIRSGSRIKQAEKRHFTDPSLACALLEATPEKLIGDLNTLGFMFEALCERDLRIYAESFGAKLYHYQDYNNDEIDAVIELSDGEWCAFEIKLGANKVDEGAANLNRISAKIKKAGGKEPKIRCVLCGLSNAAYRREDGVFVVPITALRN